MAQKRRKFTAQFKFETVMEVLRGEKRVTQICQEPDSAHVAPLTSCARTE